MPHRLTTFEAEAIDRHLVLELHWLSRQLVLDYLAGWPNLLRIRM